MTESFDENGVLNKVEFNYPDNFNFAFDVVDEIAKKSPDKLAMLWLSGDQTKEHRFTFKDIAEASKRAANYFVSLGIKKGDIYSLLTEE